MRKMFFSEKNSRSAFGVMSLCTALFVALPVCASAATDVPFSQPLATQASYNIPVAVSVRISATHLSYGDLIAYDRVHNIYRLTHSVDDPDVFGVATERPPLVFVQDTESIPVVRSGPVLVNVVLDGGPIAKGDVITPSAVPGKGQRGDPAKSLHVVGIATEAFSGGYDLVAAAAGKTGVGTIFVNTDVEGYRGGFVNKGVDPKSEKIFGMDETLVRTLLRYILATIIMGSSLYLAFHSYMSNVNYGIISVGRNPLAKSSIQAMIVFNAVIALVITGAGLFVAAVVLFVPV